MLKSSDMLAGCACGCTTRLIIAPLDVVKIKLQTQVRGRAEAPYRNLPQALGKIFTEEGVLGAWRGNTAAECLYVSYTAVQFAVYHSLKRAASGDADFTKSTIDGRTAFLAGSVSGVVSTAVTYPFDIIRTQMAVRGRASMSFTSIVSDTLRREGPAGLFHGIRPSLVQTAIYMGCNFMVYEQCVRSMRSAWGGNGDEETSSLVMGASGVVAGMVSKLIAFPADTLKKRIQANQIRRDLLTPSQRMGVKDIGGAYNCARIIASTEGVSAFYGGVGTAMVKAAVAAGVAYPLYAYFQKLLAS